MKTNVPFAAAILVHGGIQVREVRGDICPVVDVGIIRRVVWSASFFVSLNTSEKRDKDEYSFSLGSIFARHMVERHIEKEMGKWLADTTASRCDHSTSY